MRLCGLRAALANITQLGRCGWLHDPRLWLGAAFHEVISAVRSTGPQANAVEVWDAAITRFVQAAASHPLDRRYISPERWPSYFLVRQRCLSLASQIPQRRYFVQQLPQESGEQQKKVSGVERRYVARGGLLSGRPDFYDGKTIIECKSNLPDPSWTTVQ